MPVAQSNKVRPNPYFHRGPIKSDKQQYFFGRGKETHSLLEALAMGASVSISGPRRIGKTSLLFRSLCSSIRAEYGLDGHYLLIYVDCQVLHHVTQPGLYRLLYEGIAEELSDGAVVNARQANTESTRSRPYDASVIRDLLTEAFSAAELQQLCYDQSVFRPVYEQLTPEMGKSRMVQVLIEFSDRHLLLAELLAVVQQVNPRQYARFQDRLHIVISPISHISHVPNLPADDEAVAASFGRFVRWITEQGLSLVFLFDEFETLASNGRLERSLFDDLRSLSQRYKLAYVTSSQIPLYKITCHDQATLSPSFFANFQFMPLGLMEPEEAKELINGPALLGGYPAFTDQEVAFLMDVAGLHPFFIQMACFYLLKEKMDPIKPNYERVRRQFLRETEGHFHNAWHYMSDEEKVLLMDIAAGSRMNLSEVERRGLSEKCLINDQGIPFSSTFAKFAMSQSKPSQADEGIHRASYGSLDYELGLERMKARLSPMQTEVFLRFTSLEQRLLESLDVERQFGSHEGMRSERVRVMQELNRLTHDCELDVSFNDLCRVDNPERHPKQRGG